jgi:superfamily II DNA or RNA helicase
MIAIELTNNKVQLKGDLKILNKVYEAMAIRHPNAFFLRPHMPRGWDGKIHYLTDKGSSRTGLLPMIIRYIEEFGGSYIIKDFRTSLEYEDVPTRVGKFKARDYQIEAAESIVYNEILGIPFQRGIVGAATNAGKTLIAALIYKSFPKSKCLILVNNTDLYKQFLDDMPEMFGSDWGYMQGKTVKWADIMVCMTPTLRNNLDTYARKLAAYNMVIFDECHLMTSKTNKKVVTALYNTVVRVGLSGTPFDHKDKTKNMDIRSFFGDEVYKIKNLELMEMGYSTPIVIKIVSGNTKIKIKGDYDEEYRQGITLSRERENKLLSRLELYLSKGRYPILIVGRYHEHVERLYDIISDKFGGKYRINYIHHKIKERKEILDLFKAGKVDILVASLIIKLGQNMPMIKCMINAASGDSAINALQLIGRAIRIHKTKKKVYFEDFYDQGAYLLRHSKHRLSYYKREGFKVIELYKETRKS